MENEREAPIRTCLGCGAKRPKWKLLRVARLPDGKVRFDPDQRLPGRGVYLCPREECIRRAFKRRRISRALGRGAPADLRLILERAAEIYRSTEEVNCGGKG